MAESINNMSVSGSNLIKTEMYSEFIDFNNHSYVFPHQAHSSKILNENIMESSVITNDNKSTMSVNEIGTDEYFDDVLFNNDVFEDATTDYNMQVGLSSDVNMSSNDCNELNNILDDSLELPNMSIVNSRKVNMPITPKFKCE